MATNASNTTPSNIRTGKAGRNQQPFSCGERTAPRLRPLTIHLVRYCAGVGCVKFSSADWHRGNEERHLRTAAVLLGVFP